MKLVIITQCRENYAAHDGFDGEYYWKMKGGNYYVVENLRSRDIDKIMDNGIPRLTQLIEEKNDYFEEYVISFGIHGDDEQVWEDYDTPIVFSWGGDRWLAEKNTFKGAMHYAHSQIERQREEWIPQIGGERAHYKKQYQLQGSDEWIDEKNIMKALEAA